MSYGYNHGDRVIYLLSRILRDIVRGLAPGGFVGHIGGDDFVVVTTAERQDDICKEIIQVFDTTIPGFYDQIDRDSKFIQVENRSGAMERFPVMSITIAVVNNNKEQFPSSHVIAERAAELKKYLKRFKGSNYLAERRGARNDSKASPSSGPSLQTVPRVS